MRFDQKLTPARGAETAADSAGGEPPARIL